MTLSENWEFVRTDLGGVWETLRSERRALQLPVWTPVTLPHCYNAFDAVDPDVAYYEGPAWYRTQLEIDNPYPGGRTLLHFEGVGQKSQVWIGEQLAGEHVGGYDEFVVDITDAVAAYRNSPLPEMPANDYGIEPGMIPLAVRADNSRDLEMIPSDLSDFNLYGGIYRPVHLVYLPAGGLMKVHATPELRENGNWQVTVSAQFAEAGDQDESQQLQIRVVAPDGQEVASQAVEAKPTAGSRQVATLTIEHGELWSPSAPKLYGLEAVSKGPGGESRVWTRFGLRTFEFVEHGPFKLNGERLLLRGTHRHEDHAGYGAAMPEELMEEELRLMKDMGVNFIRLGHYQQSRRILELCDELGIVVWEEIPWCRGGLGGEIYKDQARHMLRAMIDQHRNHPSVIIWGLGNENDWPGDFKEFDEGKIREFMTELNDLAHELDPTRKTAIRRCDFCKDIVDVYSPSIWAGWYRGKFTEYREVSEREMKQVDHFLHMEWGGDSHAGRHAEDPYKPLRDLEEAGAADERGLDFLNIGGDARASMDGDWSETYICDLVDWHLKEQEKMDWLTGTAMWPFKDFSTPLRPENPVPFVNQKGAVERDLTPKESFYVYQSYWSDKPMVRIYSHSWPVRWGKEGEKRWVKVYSNCEAVELWLNGESQGVKQRKSQDFPAAGLRWELPFKEGMNSLRAVGKKDGETVTDKISFRYETRQWGEKDHLRIQEMKAEAGRVTVLVELLDKQGVVCLVSREMLRFEHAGDGRLIDNLGTADAAHVVGLRNGRAQIDVELPPGGKAVVSASVEGVPTALLHVERPNAGQKEAAQALRETSRQERFRDVAEIDRERILRMAGQAMQQQPVDFRSAELPAFIKEAGAQPGDFLSMGDYWWPNPETADGLPYIRRDGESNPDNFDAHRMLMRQMKRAVATLAAAYLVSGDANYAQRAAEWLDAFFVDGQTRMNPHLRYAQAIPGITNGRGIGIIDTLHLAEAALAADAIDGAHGAPTETMKGVRQWFTEYLDWMLSHPHGQDEAATINNHSVAYYLQVAVFARYVGNEQAMQQARNFYRERLLKNQLAPDGSFPRELVRTKPYGYSIFQLDNAFLLAEVLSTPGQNLYEAELEDGRSLARAASFLYPYLADRQAWPYPEDVSYFEEWPVRQPALLLGAYAYGKPKYLKLWKSLEPDPENAEVRRNMAVTQPLLWVR